MLRACAIAVAPASHAAESELCPLATERLNRSVAYQRSDNVISAPTTADEVALLMTTVQNDVGESRRLAIMRLALAGNLDAFRLLFASADVDALRIYASYYINADDTVCIDELLEDALVDHLGDRKLDSALLSLFGNNAYRSKRTLQAPLDQPLDPRQTNRYHALGRAVTATYLPGIEPDVLAFARGLLPFGEPAEQKEELAYRVLENGATWYRREALRYLIAADPQGTVDRLTGGLGHYLPLHQLLPRSATLQLLFSESRRMGYRLEQTDAGYTLARYSSNESSMP